MSNILSFEADRRTINITVNSLGTALSKEQRASLFPELGKLYPAGNNVLARADEVDQVRQVVEMVPEYREFFTASASKAFTGTEDGSSGNVAENLEDHFFRVSTVSVYKWSWPDIFVMGRRKFISTSWLSCSNSSVRTRPSHHLFWC